MRLKEKTQKKFLDYFDKMSQLNQGNEFELAYSEIQRETGAASVTLKRAIQALEDERIIEVSPGRNSRYAKFKCLMLSQNEPEIINEQINKEVHPKDRTEVLAQDIDELTHLVDGLRRRIRTQEMTLALLQDRLAEVEDKLHKY